ncbi:hypothetical protein LCGC14_2048130, partial [marine sediment metagenome]
MSRDLVFGRISEEEISEIQDSQCWDFGPPVAEAHYPLEPVVIAGPSEIYDIYTDGRCSPTPGPSGIDDKCLPGPGGYGAVIISPDKYSDRAIELAGWECKTTTNRMGLTAVIKALDYLPRNSAVIVYSSSEYVADGINYWFERWGERKNFGLWCDLRGAARRHAVTFAWSRVDSGNQFSDRAIELAT